jgi:ATP-dependent Clp protease ATP-binding subunit ClpA
MREKRMDGNFRNTVLTMRRKMKKVIFGQDAAIDALDRALKISFSGLRTKNKTAGAFLFLGPTGSGKTETAEQLAEQLGVPCKRIDCAEFQLEHEIAKLISAPPGFKGHQETTGILTKFYDQAKEARFGVLIFDEIEKAHPSLYRLLLGMMDKATVTDGQNRTLKFENVILIMTSNIGEKDRKRASLGFGPRGLPRSKIDPAPATEDPGEEARALAPMGPPVASTGKENNSPPAFNAAMLRLVFSPEFMGRLDGVVNFADLSPGLIPLIAGKFVSRLKEQAKDNLNGAINLDVKPAALDYIVEKGYQPEQGARSILTFLDQAIVGRLADELIAGRLEGGGDVVIDVEQDAATREKRLSFKFGKEKVASKPPETSRRRSTASEAPGTMPDGTIFAGVSPDTGKPMYVAPADAPLRMTFAEAKKYAAELDACGHKDWRLPTKAELGVLFNNRAAIGGFDASGAVPAGWYWSASQYDTWNAWVQRFSDGYHGYNLKSHDSSLRCVRSVEHPKINHSTL